MIFTSRTMVHRLYHVSPMFKEEHMTAQIIDGKAIAATIREEIKAEVEAMKARYGKVPGLAAVLVGERKDSQSYVRSKKKACAEAGIASFGNDLPADISQQELLQVVRDLNANPEVHGILVQLPLPDHIDDEEILGAISLEKDVDGFHPINIGRLSMKRREPLFVPCTPKGCIELLDRMGIPIEGKQAVVLGRSNIVGLPVAMLLLHRNATVTICHSRTKDLPGVVRQADILVAAVGRAEMVRGDWVKPGVAVIDVGINAVDDPTNDKGYKLVGDVAFHEVAEVASAITPVPGGVGPMTIAMLLRNTTNSAKRAFGME
jgi:5,10-methylene-tetrahydrofolate dehydrogenase/methenyl tetrahydrofolate cyclohydrolase